MDRYPVQEKLYEFCHLPGSNVSTFWRDVRAVIASDTQARETTPPPKGLSSITGNDAQHSGAEQHTPRYHGDSPTPPQGLPPVPRIRTPDTKTLICCETRPPNSGEELYIVSTNNGARKLQTRHLDKFQSTRPISRALDDVVDESSTCKREKEVNVVERVDKFYVRSSRIKEAEVSERADSQFLQPAPPPGPKPKVRRQNHVQERILRDRGNIRPNDVPGDPPDKAYLTPATSYYQMPEQPVMATSHQTRIPDHENSQSGDPPAFYGNPPALIPREMRMRHGGNMSSPATNDLGREWSQDHHARVNKAKERIQRDYVDDVRFKSLLAEDTGPISALKEIELDIRRQVLLERKAEAAAAEKAERLVANRLAATLNTGSDQGKLIPAPPTTKNASATSYSRRKRRLVSEQVHSMEENMGAKVTEDADVEKRAIYDTESEKSLNATTASWNEFKSKLRSERVEFLLLDEETMITEETNSDTNTAAICKTQQINGRKKS